MLGRKTQDFKPNVVLATAIYVGLSALVRLASKRKCDYTEALYEKIHDIWKKVREDKKKAKDDGSHDFSPVQNAESPLRKLNHRMLWRSTKRYGNKETKRVYSWKEGSIGPLNSMLNYAGATLRDVVVPRYPFPTPQLYEIREFHNGTKTIVAKDVADKVHTKKGAKTHIRAGYRGNSKNPRVLLTHPSLPAMDFGDMIRAHLIELCRQCFIHNVPRSESHRYIRLLIHRLGPFLDWVYTQGKVGRKDFYPDADKELRKIVLDIRKNYSMQIGSRERISKQQDEPPQSFGINTLTKRVMTIMETSDDTQTKKKCKAILKHIKGGLVTYREISKFIDDIMKKVQQEGNNWHRVLLSGYAQPHTLKEAVYAGDYLLQTPSGIQYLAEVPISRPKGFGKIDLVLFARNQRAGQYIWTPIMILEVKTKTGFNFNLYGRRPRTKKPKVFVPVLNAWKEPLTKPEWNAMMGSVPPRNHLDQLDAYEDALLSEYSSLVGESFEDHGLWKGVVTLDVSQEYEDTKRAFDHLIDRLAERLLKGEFGGQWKTLRFDEEISKEQSPRVAITMTPTQGPVAIVDNIVPLTARLYENPFRDRVDDNVFFTQYISLSSPTSSGKTASWLAKNWHLLNHLTELEKTATSETSLVWIDLTGDFPTEKLIEKRFRLDSLKKDGLIKTSEHSKIKGLLKSIKFVSLRDEVDTFLTNNEYSGFETIRTSITSTLKSQSLNHIVVVDGWSDLESMIPTNCRINLAILENALLDIFKEQVNEVIWTDTGIHLPRMSEIYQRTCSSPLYYSSPRRQVIDEILWNLPTAPRKIGWQSPEYEDSRVIIQDLPTEQVPWSTVIYVPQLKGLGRKFSRASVQSPTIRIEDYSGDINQHENMYGRAFSNSTIQVLSDAIDLDSLNVIIQHAFDLVPSLNRPRHRQPKVEINDTSTDLSVSYHNVDVNRTHPSLSSRLHLDVNEEPPHPNRIGKDHEGIYVEAEKITRGWIHKESDEEKEESGSITRRPANFYTSESSHIDTIETRRREIHRLLYATQFLSRKPTYFRSLYREISSLCTYDRSIVKTEEALFDILTQAREAILRRPEPRLLWKLLRNERANIGNLLNPTNQKILKNAVKHNQELLDLYGMNLFLVVLSVADRILGDVKSPHCRNLWSSIARWQFYQMGFEYKQDETFEYRYDFQAIHSNLSWRAKQMKKMVSGTSVKYNEQFGQLLWKDEGDWGNIWLLFPSFKNTIVGGFIEDRTSEHLPFGWYRCVIDPEQTKEAAEDALSKERWKEYAIALVDVSTQRVLFVEIEGEDGVEWALAGAFEYGNPPREKNQPVRWVRLSQPLPETLLALYRYTPGSSSSEIKHQCDRVLREAADWSGVMRTVTCFLTINPEKKVYRIDLIEDTKTIAKKETSSTDEIIRYLRIPFTKGEYFSTSDGTYLKWNPLKDVEYDDVTIQDENGRLDMFSLSIFKPLIHRASFYPDRYTLPSTCEELLQTKEGEDITLQITVDEQLKNLGSKKYLKLHFDGLKKSGELGFEGEEMGIFDVALLSECEQLVDVESSRRYNISINAESLLPLRMVHLLSEYPKLQSTIMSHIEDLQLAEAEEYEEGGEEDREYIEPKYIEGLEEEPEYIEPDYDG